jgi:hypothetical protein
MLITLFIGLLTQTIQPPPLSVARKGRMPVEGMDLAQSSTSRGTASGERTGPLGKPSSRGGAILAPDSFRTADTNK